MKDLNQPIEKNKSPDTEKVTNTNNTSADPLVIGSLRTSELFREDEDPIVEPRMDTLNEDILKGKWHEIQGEVKKQWGKLTDDDLLTISGEKEKLVGVLQTKYGYAKDKAEAEYKSFIDKQKK